MASTSQPDAARTLRPVRFVLDGEIVDAHATPTTTLLQYLRERLGRTGTKEGCAEGDCGACTVMVGRLDGERIDYRAVNSCIRFLPTLDGKEVVTVESLKADGALHPVQRAMIEHHGSQCGFCTPGFVMSLLALYMSETHPEREQVVTALSGNLCRCTGYRPIIDAGCHMNDYPEPGTWSRADAQSALRRMRLTSLHRRESLALPGYRAPTTLDELSRLYVAEPHSLLLAGGTDIGLWVTKQLRALPPLIYVGDVPELRQIGVANSTLSIGAAVTLTEAHAAIVRHYPMLDELFDRFGSPPIRNSGTLCGNIANGSPIGDAMPALIALGAQVGLRRAKRESSIALEDLYLGYQKNALATGEFVVDVRIPLPRAGRFVASYKIAKRYDQDISSVCAGFAFDIRDATIAAVRIAYGGMAPTPKRATRTEVALTGQPWSIASIEAALPKLAEDFQPITDMRASAHYRLQVAGNLLKRFHHEHTGTGVPTRVHTIAGVPSA